MHTTQNDLSETIEKKEGAVANVSLSYPVKENERERLEALQLYHILDSAEEKDFDELTELASAICQTPVALISLVDANRQWFKSHKGVAIRETPKEHSFCAHAIASPEEVMIVKDAKQDVRFATNPFVTGELNLTFYAGVPLVNKDGFALGSLCVIDDQVRDLSAYQIAALQILAKQVIDKLELKRKVIELEEANAKFRSANQALAAVDTKIHATENRFRSLVEQAPVAIANLKGRELIIELANATMLQLWEKDDSIIGKLLRLGLPELDVKPFLQILDDVYTSGTAYYGHEAKVALEQNGKRTEKYFNFVYQPLFNEEAQVESIMVIASEVTEQVATRSAIQETSERLQMALDAGKLGSYDHTISTGELVCPAQCKSNFGLPADAVFHYTDLVAAIMPEHREYVQQQVETAIANNTVYNAEYQVRWPDGSIHWIMASGKPVYDHKGKAIRMIGVTYENTERKTLEQQKDDFLSIASHELKTPVTSLKASLQLLYTLKDKPATHLSARLIEVAHRSAEKMSTLVDDLLNVNRIDHHQLYLNKSSFVLATLLHQCCQQVRLEDNHQLIFQGDSQLTVDADENRIEQVIVNLVNNAVKYAPQSKEIYLVVEKEGAMAKVSVKDNGPGIPPDRQPNLFKRYYRANHAGSTYSGLGLGLYICAEIIHKHGGQIGVTSTEGKGSTFWFTLPLIAGE